MGEFQSILFDRLLNYFIKTIEGGISLKKGERELVDRERRKGRERGKEGRREGGKEGRREGGKEGRRRKKTCKGI